MYKKMSTDEVYGFVQDHVLTAHLATVRKDGRPHVSPVWVTVDGTDIVFSTGRDTVKGKNLLRTGYAAISMDDNTPPFNSVRIEGPVEFSEDPEEVQKWAGIIGGRYMGEDKVDVYAERNGVPGEMIVRIKPERVSGLRGVADFHEE